MRHLLYGALRRDDVERRNVHPIVGEGRDAAVGLALRDLVLVVREDQVLSAAVDVDALAKHLEDHRRALDVPARPARAPGAVPRGFAGFGPLPEREVAGVL